MFNRAILAVNEPTGDGSRYRCMIVYVDEAAGVKEEQHLDVSRAEATDMEFIRSKALAQVADFAKSTGKVIPPGTEIDLTPLAAQEPNPLFAFLNLYGRWQRLRSDTRGALADTIATLDKVIDETLKEHPEYADAL